MIKRASSPFKRTPADVRYGQKQTSRNVHVMSVIPLEADIHQRGLHVRLVPVTDSEMD
jgi:hypothetical protein